MNRKTTKIIAAVIVVAFAIGLIFIINSNLKDKNAEHSLSEEMFAMDTVMKLTVYETAETDCDLNVVMDEMRELIYRMESEFSVTDGKSEISKLNDLSSSGEWLTVSDEVWELIDKAKDIADSTGFDIDNDVMDTEVSKHAFDPTLYPIVKLWGFTTGTEEHVVPDEDDINRELQRIGVQNIEMGSSGGKHDVRLINDAQIDLGACVKGYLSDKLCEILKAHHVNGVLSLGGNVQTVGTKPDGSPFVIGITDPKDGTSLFTKLESSDEAVITSGNYERFFEVDGHRYHHIMDSRTGMPAESGLSSVTVIGKSGLYCDVYATAFFVMGEDLTKKYLEKKQPDYRVIMIRDDGSYWCSDGVKLIEK
ncbi:MAG: FAD:protein FMN transferase [Eubacterium sp.]|nr:FAD:protein FMN transferase [Eubacterium sp.]